MTCSGLHKQPTCGGLHNTDVMCDLQATGTGAVCPCTDKKHQPHRQTHQPQEQSCSATRLPLRAFQHASSLATPTHHNQHPLRHGPWARDPCKHATRSSHAHSLMHDAAVTAATCRAVACLNDCAQNTHTHTHTHTHAHTHAQRQRASNCDETALLQLPWTPSLHSIIKLFSDA
jgi:hypothetical protein